MSGNNETMKARLAALRRKSPLENDKSAPDSSKSEVKKTPKAFGDNARLFSSVKGMTTPGKTIPKAWSNAELSKIPIYAISPLTPTEAVVLGKQMIGMLLGNNATRDLIDIMLFLAVSLRDPNNPANLLLAAPSAEFGAKTALGKPNVSVSEEQNAPSSDSAFASGSSKSDIASRLAERKAARNVSGVITKATAGTNQADTSGVSSENKAAIYSFVAAFFLRAHSRQPDSLIDSIPRMIERCASWYDGAERMLESLVVDRIMIDGIKNLLARREEVMSTWVMWVAFNENETNMNKNNQGMMSYLAGQIYQYTGLHAVVQVLAIQQVTKVPMDQLLGELNHRSTRQALLALYDLLQHHELVKEKPGRKTYFRYARIWDSGYFHELQSKQCPDLVFLAARILKEVSPTGARSDPTKIYAIQDLGDIKKEFLTEVAMKISRWLVSADDDTGDSGAAWAN
uniref:Nucleoprotein n=1 Tax=Cnidium virus 2 TaxID=3057102 RepID=A0AA96PQY8_9RHAB|nr:MAG: nucleocapsid protein [Cnidium virus 2]